MPAVYLFGSYARNEAAENSDVDILIDRQDSLIHGMFEMGGFYNDLQECAGKEIDPVTMQTLEQKRTRQRTPHFAEKLKADMVICTSDAVTAQYLDGHMIKASKYYPEINGYRHPDEICEDVCQGLCQIGFLRGAPNIIAPRSIVDELLA